MRQRKYFYIVTDQAPEAWERNLEGEGVVDYEKFIGSHWWPYTLTEARKERTRIGYERILKFGLPFHEFIKEVK